MKQCRFILNDREDGFYNIALDEALMLSCKSSEKPFSAFRLYTWKNPCLTIGYFQKYADIEKLKIRGAPIIRRLTGGLAVNHVNDLSYSFITNASQWPYVYDQEKSYKAVHSAIKEALISLGIKAEFIEAPLRSKNNSVCVKTLFDYDLQLNGEKILGSCQRRSGKILLQQGSIRIPKQIVFKKAVEEIKISLKNALKMDLIDSKAGLKEEHLSANLIKEKYSNIKWVKKF